MGATLPIRSATRTYISVGKDLLKLSKYRLSALVAFTAGVGYAARADPHQDNPKAPPSNYWRRLSSVTAGTWLVAASANTLNQIYEIQSDALMLRTRNRPLPSRRLSLLQAATFAAFTGASGLLVLLKETNKTTATIAAANLALYAAVYTPLKPISTINTWIGSLVGALPPIHGWAAASDGDLSGERERGAWALGALLFTWQIPHFHALAVVSRADYAAGGLKMLAVSDPAANALWARIMAGAMVPLGGAFVASGVTSGVFGFEAALLGAWMFRGAGRMMEAPASIAAARPLFKASIFHLPITLSLLLAHRVPYGEVQRMPVLDRRPEKEWRIHQPWETIAPFPFLPVPCGVPAVVLEADEG